METEEAFSNHNHRVERLDTVQNVKNVSDTKKKYFTCDICGQIFFPKGLLENKFPAPKTVNGHCCDVCRSDLSQPEKRYSCDFCNKEFSQKVKLNRHLPIHARPFSCHLCHKEFSLKCNLKSHYRTHTHEKPFSCDVCHKEFSARSNLTLHYRIHTNEKPYSCDVCHKVFSDKSNLNRHLRTHVHKDHSTVFAFTSLKEKIRQKLSCKESI